MTRVEQKASEAPASVTVLTRDDIRDLLLLEAQSPFQLLLEGNYFDTESYMAVKASRRGSIDTEADSRQRGRHLDR